MPPEVKAQQEDPSSIKPANNSNAGSNDKNKPASSGFFSTLKGLISKPKGTNNDDALREAIEDFMGELEEDDISSPVATHEKSLISNVLKLRDTTVLDVMIPRADIAGIEVNASQEALMELLAERQFSRIAVYKENLDDILGSIHIKDILSVLASKKDVNIKSMIRNVPIVSPSLPVLDLLRKMQSEKKHMVFVVDEYGGIDGLATIGDVIEAIVGEFDDEFDTEDDPQMVKNTDGSVLADARVDIDEFEEEFGLILSEEEREEVDTLGGLVFFTASRIPARGEVIKHESGMVFEIVSADQRRINSMRIRNIPEREE